MKLPLLQEIAYPAQDALPMALAADGRTVFLESAERTAGGGRFSYLLWDPFWTLRWDFGVGWRSESGPSASDLPADPWTGLETVLAGCPFSPVSVTPFAGGAAGYFSYELAATLEDLPELATRKLSAPAARFSIGDVVLSLDHERRRAFLVSQGWPASGREREARARERMESARSAWDAALALETGARVAPAAKTMTPAAAAPTLAEAEGLGLLASLSSEEYASRFARLRDYLEAGHVYQANLSLAYRVEASLSPRALYAELREANPAPYAALFPGREASVLSASPELFLRRRGDRLVTRPIKGTRPRGGSAAEDARLADALRASAKDLAEHVMIVDVHRNDLGRVARYGSVRVPEPWALESFASVHHLTSTVEARLRPGLRPLAAVRAAFPAGSITGAPKIRAMEILAALEPHARGPYTGALGWLAPGGDFDLAVGIRTLTVTPSAVEFPAGGGIVLDSTAEAEYEEAWQKARALWACVRAVSTPAPSPRQAAAVSS